MAKASIKRGDIYFITGIEATGSEQGGERPAVIVSNDIGNKYAPSRGGGLPHDKEKNRHSHARLYQLGGASVNRPL